MLFISLVNLLSVFHKSLKQSTPLANLHHLQHEGFLVAQLVKNPPAMWKTWVPSLGWENPLEIGKVQRKGKVSSPWPEEFHGLYSP